MKLSELKQILTNLNEIRFILPNGELIPPHFHITEIGVTSKHFIDCGGSAQQETKIRFQLWTAEDYDHRLAVSKLISIIKIAEERIKLNDDLIEVEYQRETIGLYDLVFDGDSFVLVAKQTNCLAKDRCGIPASKPKMRLSQLHHMTSCDPQNGCC